MENTAKIIEEKVENLKNSPFYSQLEIEINEMFFKIIRSVTEENRALKRQNDALKRVVKNTMNEKEFKKFQTE
ncbi:MAG: hypothetical protein IJA97_01845 [Clostridia bacterium]|nr:hypothetical protein [Clostridia bacterium]